MTRGSKWIPLDKYLAQEFKSIKREFSMIEAMFSYQLDIDCKIIGTISGYSKLWGWSRNKVRKFINGIGTDQGHIKDSKRTHEGHPIHLIDLSLNDKKDRSRTDKGQVEDTLHDTTTKPNPKPNPILKKKNTKKETFLLYLEQKIIQNNMIETKDKIFEFFNYRMNEKIKGKKQPYSTEKGIDGLFVALSGCKKSGLIISECLDRAMQDEWLKPDPSYFKNNVKNKFSPMTRDEKNREECEKFIYGEG